MYEELKDLLENNGFSYGTGCSTDCVKEVEFELGVEFPHSYRWFLQHFDGGAIGSDDLYAIDLTPFERPDIRRYYLSWRELNVFAEDEFPFFEQGTIVYFFKLSEVSSPGEYNIYEREAPYGDELYETSFGGFLKKQLLRRSC